MNSNKGVWGQSPVANIPPASQYQPTCLKSKLAQCEFVKCNCAMLLFSREKPYKNSKYEQKCAKFVEEWESMDSIWKTGKMQYSQLRHCEKWLWHCKLVSKHHKSCFQSLLQISFLIRGGRKKKWKTASGKGISYRQKKTHFSIR